MIYLCAVLLLLLLFVSYRYYKVKQALTQDLPYISSKLNQIVRDRSTERLLVMTEERQLRELLADINSLLDYHQDYTTDSARVRMSMNRMLSNVSHDLKTPLTVILGYVETIRHDQDYTPGEQDALLSKVHDKVIEVTRLINKFFDLAKLEADDWKIEMAPVDAAEVCRKTILGYYDTLTGKDFNVAIDLPEDPVFLYADADALTRILENLLSNAIRYGKEGKTVGLTLREENDHVLIEVWDSGKGILEKDINKIFERLYTLDEARSTSAEGSGLGLTIAKRLTERMKGQIGFSSIPFKKTVFTVRFKKLQQT